MSKRRLSARWWSWVAVPLAVSCLYLGVTLLGAIESSRRDQEYWSRQAAQVRALRQSVNLLVDPAVLASAAAWRKALANYGSAADPVTADWEHKSDPIRETLRQSHRSVANLSKARQAGGDVSEARADLIQVASQWGRTAAGFETRSALAASGPQEKWHSAVLLSLLACMLSFLLIVLQRSFRAESASRAEAERRLAESGKRLAELEEVSGVARFRTDPEGRVIETNRVFDEILAGTSLGWIVQAVRDPGPNRTHSVTGRDGTRLTIQVTVAASAAGAESWFPDPRPARRAQKAEERAAALEQQLHEMEERLAGARNDAAANLSRRSEVLGRIAGDLRQPVGSLVNLSLKLLETPLSAGQTGCADQIRGGAEEAAGLIAQIDEYARIESGQVEFTSEPFSLRAVIEDLSQTPACETACWVAPGTPDLLIGDAARVRQIVQCLIDNAGRPPGVRALAVRASRNEDPQGHLKIRVAVRQLIGGTSPERPAGMSLAIARQLAERLGGAFTSAFVPHEGTEFTLCLPFHLHPGTQPPLTVRATHNPKLLLACECPASSRMITEFATAWGWQVAACEAAQLQATAARSGPYHAIVLDHQVAGAPQLDTAERILQDPGWQGAGVVLLVPPAFRSWVNEPLLHGLHRIVAKPLREAALFAALQAMAASDRPMAEPASGKVLIVEDNTLNQRITQRLVERLGFQADIAENGSIGVELARQNSYAAILMDWRMPVMDGLEATAAIRALDPPARSTPIIALTANVMEGDREICLDAGMDEYLSKPATIATLRDSLAHWTGRRSTKSAAAAMA